jgi:hypothetical protein
MVILMHTISRRMARYLEKSGLITQGMESAYLNFLNNDEDSLLQLQGASVCYLTALKP